MKKCKCQKCGYVWVSRVENPVEAPCCKSRYWNGTPQHLRDKKIKAPAKK